MFTEKAFDTAPIEEAPVELPLRILLALPRYVTDDPAATVFNLPGAIGRLLGRAGADRAIRVLMPQVWAPGFSAKQLRKFATSPFLDRPGIFDQFNIEGWRVRDSPGTGFLGAPSGSPVVACDVVQFAGRVEMPAGEPLLLTGVSPGGGRLRPGALRDALVAARTRLLVLGVPGSDFRSAVRLADIIAGGGGPAVVIVAGRDGGTVNLYLLNLYANIVHNQLLPQLAKPDANLERPWLTVGELPVTAHADALSVHVAYARGQEGRLTFSDFKGTLDSRVARLHRYVATARSRLDQFKAAHDAVRSHMEPARNLQIEQLSAVAGDALIKVSNLAIDSGGKLAQVGWDHESEGVIPLSESAEAVFAAETSARVFEALRPDQIRAEASVQTRIVNANVADPSGRMLDTNERLSAGKKYELLVDVGPPWDPLLSIVRGSPKFGSKFPPPFPQGALPDAPGWVIDVVFISEQCRPRISSARLWLPSGAGRSVPYLDSLPSWQRDAKPSSDYPERALHSGPVALPVLVETLPAGRAESTAVTGRLCFYYENNLLQAAMVKLGLAGGRTDQPQTGNVIEIDFTLNGTLGRLDGLSERSLNFEPGSKPERHPIAMAVTLNDDGGSGHRVIVRMKSDEIVGFAPIDPLSLTTTVDRARTLLSSCFYLKNDATGAIVKDASGVGRYAFSKTTNGKPKRQFAWDLMLMAEYGQSLFLQAFGQIITQSGKSAAAWMRDLRTKLVDGQVIQITRTNSVPAQYAFPWAMIYDYDLPGPRKDYTFCEILAEWTDEGIRNGSAARRCPEQKSHGDNTVCPYGFWGLKHIIEQPPSIPTTDNGNASDAISQITIHNGLDLAVGLTRDKQFDGRTLDDHVTKLSAIPGLRLAPQNPAENSASLQAMLRTPQLLYFLCHVEGNPQRSDETFLSIGPHDGLPDHRISVYTLNGWMTKAGAPIVDLAWWSARRPLVFINGCHSANLTPGQMVSFVTAFTGAGASGVIGTEVSVTLPIAIEFAERVLERINQPAVPGATQRVPIGEAIRQVRWDLANKGNLLGLAYTPYCLANLQLVADGL
jgi:CHAT domain